MNHLFNRRQLVAASLGGLLLPPAFGAAPSPKAAKGGGGKPLNIYGITFRGMTDVERGFEDYFASRKIPVQITWRDLNRDASRMPGYIEEIRATKPDLVYTWGTSVTLGVVGPHDAADKSPFINDIPVVFTLVAAPVLAKIVPEVASSGRNVTGVTHVAPTEAQVRAMAQYRPLQNLGVIYTSTERNSVVILEELRKLARERNFKVIERPFKLDASNKPVADGAADLVRELKAAGAQWLYLPPDSFLGTLAEGVIIPAAMDNALPTFASTEQLMQAGALTGLVSKYYNLGQFTAHKVEQILVAKQDPKTMPVETLKRFSYQISMSAAQRLKLPPPMGMLNFAELINTTNSGS
jgi:putative tryptophan/tyrosine transport system substrate-binding protein